MRVAISGGAGFAGHHLVEHILKNTDWEITILDKLSYASNGLERLRDIKAFNFNRCRIITCDFSKELSHGVKQEIGNSIDFFLHLAAETHVDNSIGEPWPFIEANLIGTYHMLQYVRELPHLKKVVYFSTDEVFGPAGSIVDEHDGTFGYDLCKMRYYREWDRYHSTNPYSATKAGGEELCLAWANTYKVPVIITHCMNLFGERQHYEKFIPKVVRACLTGEKVFIHAYPDKKRAGSRSYIHCRNMASAILFLLEKEFTRTDKFNIAGEAEVDNLSLALKIEELVDTDGMLNYELVDFHSSRPGHDLRYALDGTKMKTLGWEPKYDFLSSLEKTVEWMVAPENKRWLNF